MFINKLRLERGEAIGVEVKHFEKKMQGSEVKGNCNLFDSMRKRAVNLKQSEKDYTWRFNNRTKEDEVIFRNILLSAGHGDIIKPTSTNKPGIGTEIKETKNLAAAIAMKNHKSEITDDKEIDTTE